MDAFSVWREQIQLEKQEGHRIIKKQSKKITSCLLHPCLLLLEACVKESIINGCIGVIRCREISS